MKTNYSTWRTGLAATALSCLSIAAFAQGTPTPTTPVVKPAATVPAATTTPAAATTPAKPATPTVITWSGFVRADYFYDTRQTVNAREGHLLFVPAAVRRDANGADINASPEVNMLAIQSRLKVGVTGPEFFNMKTSGAIEAEFLGTANGDINGLRLRHAYVQLTGAKAQILMGQYWHPFFATDCFPGTHGFTTGAPFATIERNPQFKLSSVGKTKVFVVVSTQRDFKNQGTGTDPTNTSSAANSYSGVSLSGIPVLSLGVSHSDGPLAAGATIEYKTIKPSLINGAGLKSDVTLSSLSAHAYIRYKKGTTTFKAQTIYGQDNSDMLMLGGYGIADSVGKDPKLTALTTSSSWAEIDGGNAKMEWGLFVGYAKSLGFGANLKTATGINGFLTDIKDMVRVAPRIAWKSGKTKIGVELEYTQVTRGAYKAGESVITELAVDSKTKNTRLLVFAQYNF
jgi:hypothetical protein